MADLCIKMDVQSPGQAVNDVLKVSGTVSDLPVRTVIQPFRKQKTQCSLNRHCVFCIFVLNVVIEMLMRLDRLNFPVT